MPNNKHENLPEVKEIDEASEQTISKDDEELDVEEPSQIWKTLLKYGITILVGAALVFAVLGINSFFSTPNMSKAEYFRKLSDAFTVPGLFFILLSLLILVSSKGAFTGIGYALRHVARMLLPFLVKKDITYAEYVENKKKHTAVSMIICFLLVGTILLVVGIILIRYFYKYY